MNARQRKFAHEYVRSGFNGVQSAIRAGYTDNYFAAAVHAHRLLKNAKVTRTVEKHLQEAKISADEVLEELSSMARAPIPREKVSEGYSFGCSSSGGK